MNSLKKAFSIAACGFGSAGTIIGALGLATGGFKSNMVDLTTIGAVFTLLSAGLAYAGYKSLRKQIETESKSSDNKPDIKP